ncbi:MAG: DUF1592 domain-containing protein [Acidobacteria bacterium]|nr:DUF1592 domain-containing protein [Acidobacteriota bacterium]
MTFRAILSAVSVASLAIAAPPPAGVDPFATSVKPALQANCGACHNPANPKNRLGFLKANSTADVDNERALWRNVATQLRNRTMPPAASNLTEEDRFRITTWIGDRLRKTACAAGDFAGSVTVRRLNRREYRNAIRDIFGIDYNVSEIFPADGSGGEGFDTNGETLFLPPILMERYLEAAQQILDRVIITQPTQKMFNAGELEPRLNTKPVKRPLQPDQELSGVMPVYTNGDYDARISIERTIGRDARIRLKVDGIETGVLTFQRYASGGAAARSQRVRLSRGMHKLSIQAIDPVEIYTFSVEERVQEAAPEKKAVHYRLIGLEPGQTPTDPRKAAQHVISRVVRPAFRRPATQADTEKFLTLYDRAAERGDPFEERLKLALKAVLVSSQFLFRAEERTEDTQVRPLQEFELASRLSFFLWSTIPDEELLRRAEQGRLSDAKVLAAQVDRMLDDPRSRTFADAFIGQWLGTREIGGKIAPTTSDVQHFYTPDVAVDLREEPVVLFHHVISQGRPILDLLDGNYTFLTERLAKFYQVEDQVNVRGSVFQRVEWPNRSRGGLLGLGGVLALTSSGKQTNPILRGAWVLDTLLGTPAPTPPPGVPPLEATGKKMKLTMREKLTMHRANSACAACHNLMDPVGLGLENFDYLGRHRTEDNGKPLDTSGTLPTGEKFTGPEELRKALLAHKEEFLRRVTGKILGYALGRSLYDADQCTVQKIIDKLDKNNYSARMLIQEVVLSVPFRNSQGRLPDGEALPAPVKKVQRAQPEK